MTVQQLQGNAVYHVGRSGSRLQPFAFAGLGATFFSAADLQSETKFSWGVGGGVKFFPCEGLGFRGHFRYKPTMLDDEDAGDFCDPFGFCQGTLQQIEIAAGGVVRF
jgi:opacity protein-like surface antigen